MPSEILIQPGHAGLQGRDCLHQAAYQLPWWSCWRTPAFKDSVMEAAHGRPVRPADWRRCRSAARRTRLVPYAVGALLDYLQRNAEARRRSACKTVQNYADAQYMRLSPVTRAEPGTDRDHARPGEAGHPALGAGQDRDRHGQAPAARLDRAAPCETPAAINRRLDAVEALYSDNMAARPI